MTSVADGVQAKYGAKKDFCSHIIGVAKKHGIANYDQVIKQADLPKIAQSYKDYTHKDFKGENLHGGKEIKFSQFVDSAAKNY